MKNPFKRLKLRFSRHWWLVALATGTLAVVLLYRLGTLTGGLSWNEVKVIQSPLGWSGLLADPFYLLFKLLQSAIFFLVPDHGQFVSRLPSVIFGGLTVLSFAWVISRWHNNRTTWLTVLLFACTAWTLHVSRLASLEVVYLSVIPALLFSQVLLNQSGNKAWAWYVSVACRGFLLYIPGVAWLVLAQAILQRQLISKQWQQLKGWPAKLGPALLGIAMSAPLIYHLATSNLNVLKSWLGLPAELEGPITLLKQFAEVFVNLFISGPANPELWLGRLPILDVFTLAMCLLGIYFYAKNWRSSRSRTLAAFALISGILIGLGGAVSLSLLVPLLFVTVATGIAYLLHEWLAVFPRNPLARSVGIGLVALAVAVSCTYNLRSYFVAWPNSDATKATFRYHL